MEYELSLRDYLAILKRRFWHFVLPFLAITIIGSAIVFILPPIYSSSGKILVESQQIPDEFIRSTVTGLANERIQIIRQRVMTRENLSQIIRKFKLFDTQDRSISQSAQVDAIRSRISIDLIETGARRGKATIAFNVSYEDRSAEQALRVANELLTLFLDENVRTRTARAAETTDFLETEAGKLQKQLEVLESQIAAFKQENNNALPEHLDLHLNMLQRSEQDLQRVDSDRKALEEELRFLKIELAAAKTGLSAATSASGPQSPSQQLAALRLQLLNYEARYSDEHPDVQSLRQRISALEQSTGLGPSRTVIEEQLAKATRQLADLQKSYETSHPDVQSAAARVAKLKQDLATAPKGDGSASNDIDIATARLEGQIAAANARLSVLKKLRNNLIEKIEDLQNRVVQTPQVERGLTALSRDYDNSLEKYEEIKAKQLQAQLAQNLEEGKKAERFTLLEPPVLAESPSKPNRQILLLIVFVLACGAGASLVLFMEVFFGGITSPSVITQITGQPPLAIIPHISTTSETHRNRQRLMAAGVAVPALFLIALAVVHFLFMPIDIFLLKIMARLG